MALTSQLILLIIFSIWSTCSADFNLTILHNNDIHARFPPITEQSSLCRPAKQSCMAGVARTVHLVNQFRENRTNQVLFLSAGDFYQGSIWYSEYKYKVVNDFVFKMGYDVMTLGNHEFDDGVDGLVPFLQAAKNHSVPVVCTNLDISREPKYSGLILPSVVKEYSDGTKSVSIGYVGYVIPTTASLSKPGNTTIFNDEIKTLKAEVAKLKKQGIKIIIALGHSGYQKDLEVAEAVPDIDILVGGHSNTFLWPGTHNPDAPPPSIEEPVDKYPTVIEHGNRKTLVVQAYAFGKYLGVLDVTFDDDGHVKHFEGEPILMTAKIPEDPVIKNLTEEYMKKMAPLFEVVGRTNVLLEGREVKCRMEECLLGNLIADAYVYNFLEDANEVSWTHYPIALVPGGGIRTSIDVLSVGGEVTFADIKNVCPFSNELVAVNITGDVLLQVFEHSVSTWDAQMKQLEGRFLQVSGMRVTYDPSKPVGHRVVSLKARCGQCTSPEYFDVDHKGHYIFITTSYMKDGGDEYSMLKNKPIVPNAPKVNDTYSIVRYFNETRIALTELQERIRFKPGSVKSKSNSVSTIKPFRYLFLMVTFIAALNLSSKVN